MSNTVRLAGAPLEIGVLLLSPCSPLTLGALIEPFSLANAARGETVFECRVFSCDGKPVTSPGGLPLPVHGGLPADFSGHAMFVAAERAESSVHDTTLLPWLAALAGRRVALGGVHAGGHWLARAGVLDGYRATVHWEALGDFVERFDAVIASQQLFEIDRDRFTSSGGMATLDMTLTLIEQWVGRDLALRLSERLCLERVRPATERQRVPLAAQLGGQQPKLTEAIQLMEANLEEPLTTDEISRYVGLSRRQLERLFKQFLNALPSKYYLELRLMRAQRFLQRTDRSVVQIGLSCGFSSGPHFSTAYRARFGITPREERAQYSQFGGPDAAVGAPVERDAGR
ncbi:AraC family transcriptional regulator [Pandoraea terrae]|uniref:AraC family transcriptional regulator n=1 Tax=Pandoraea terrae TaxID=1537710 RepID=A0A5E4ZF41_9BURK|nr:GlxA family transcriptional regulator [Pandoraea terrae]VVE59704.1 AraC family transcriptional regulator [Pandoraea terrae]